MRSRTASPVVTLNRPEVHNAFNDVMQQDLRHVWTALRTNGDIRTVVLAGAGDELMERAVWVAAAIASEPVRAVQGTLRTIWMAHENARKNALAQVSTLVSLGTEYANIEEGQRSFTGSRTEWRLR
jgi:enoyl-CoA hydratase/carnithine racemase